MSRIEKKRNQMEERRREYWEKQKIGDAFWVQCRSIVQWKLQELTRVTIAKTPSKEGYGA